MLKSLCLSTVISVQLATGAGETSTQAVDRPAALTDRQTTVVPIHDAAGDDAALTIVAGSQSVRLAYVADRARGSTARGSFAQRGRLPTGPFIVREATHLVISDPAAPDPETRNTAGTQDRPDDWNNFGGNAARNGATSVAGPIDDDRLWSNVDDFSIISWHPVTLGRRCFAIRESAFPSAGGSGTVDPVVAYDLDTGEELWRFEVPYGGDPEEEWIAYIAGANDGKVYTARGGSGRTTPVYAIDAVAGTQVWASEYETVAGPQDGIVFAADGDLIVGDFYNIVRIDADDGTTVWLTPRSCSVSGNCGAVANDSAAFIEQVAPGGQVITKVDIETGAIRYSSPVMGGFTAQNAPFLSRDGDTAYFARSQNNPTVDKLYAFRDNGSQLVLLWSRPIRWTTSHEHGIGPDGSIYTFSDANEFVRLDPATGEIVDSAGVLSPPVSGNLSPRTAVDVYGNVYVSNGWASSPVTDGRIWAFNADLSVPLFTLTLDRQNSGGPSLGTTGTLVTADRLGIYAYRLVQTGDCDRDGDVDLVDYSDHFEPCVTGPGGSSIGPECTCADVDNDADVDVVDFAGFQIRTTETSS